MLKAIRWIALITTILLIVAVAYGYSLPEEYHVEREIVVAASPEVVFAPIGDLSRHKEWNPWLQIDPDMKLKISDPSTGVGAWSEWSSDHSQVGAGKNTVTVWQPGELITMHFVFAERSEMMTSLTMTPQGDNTHLRWHMDFKADDIMGRYFGIVMDDIVGPKYEAGLAQIKAIAEGK